MAQVLQYGYRVWATWLILYLVAVAAATTGMWQARQWALDELATEDARQQWQDWRSENERYTDGSQPTARRSIEHDAPPTLLLLRDHWLVCLLGLIVTGSVVYWSFALFLTGAMRRPVSRRQK